jgi:hypothetical protein
MPDRFDEGIRWRNLIRRRGECCEQIYERGPAEEHRTALDDYLDWAQHAEKHITHLDSTSGQP